MMMRCLDENQLTGSSDAPENVMLCANESSVLFKKRIIFHCGYT